MKTIVLCRHAKSDWPDNLADIERPLKPRGEKDARHLGRFLSKKGFTPDIILSSPATRAISTAQIVANELGYPLDLIQIKSSIYYEGSGGLLSLLQGLPDEAETVMVFGHNPTMEQSVKYFLQMASPFQMPTAGMVCFETQNTYWKHLGSLAARLRWMLIPRLQRKKENSGTAGLGEF